MDAVVEFWNARPCNIKHSSLEIGTKHLESSLGWHLNIVAKK